MGLVQKVGFEVCDPTQGAFGLISRYFFLRVRFWGKCSTLIYFERQRFSSVKVVLTGKDGVGSKGM